MSSSPFLLVALLPLLGCAHTGTRPHDMGTEAHETEAAQADASAAVHGAVARDASLGHVVPEMPDCPLVPMGASAKVTSTGAGFAVEIRSDDEAAAADILARAQRLASK